MDYQEVIDHFGGGVLTKAAKKLRLSKQTVNQWKRRGGIPLHQQFVIQLQSKGRLKAKLPAKLAKRLAKSA